MSEPSQVGFVVRKRKTSYLSSSQADGVTNEEKSTGAIHISNINPSYENAQAKRNNFQNQLSQLENVFRSKAIGPFKQDGMNTTCRIQKEILAPSGGDSCGIWQSQDKESDVEEDSLEIHEPQVPSGMGQETFFRNFVYAVDDPVMSDAGDCYFKQDAYNSSLVEIIRLKEEHQQDICKKDHQLKSGRERLKRLGVMIKNQGSRLDRLAMHNDVLQKQVDHHNEELTNKLKHAEKKCSALEAQIRMNEHTIQSLLAMLATQQSHYEKESETLRGTIQTLQGEQEKQSESNKSSKCREESPSQHHDARRTSFNSERKHDSTTPLINNEYVQLGIIARNEQTGHVTCMCPDAVSSSSHIHRSFKSSASSAPAGSLRTTNRAKDCHAHKLSHCSTHCNHGTMTPAPKTKPAYSLHDIDFSLPPRESSLSGLTRYDKRAVCQRQFKPFSFSFPG